jgi:hypothetical protein
VPTWAPAPQPTVNLEVKGSDVHIGMVRDDFTMQDFYNTFCCESALNIGCVLIYDNILLNRVDVLGIEFYALS